MKKRILAITIATIALIGFAATPASASIDHCYTTPRICVWDSYDFSGSPMYFWSNPANGCINFGSAINDRARAARNIAGWVATFYTDANCSGSIVVTLSRYGSAGTYRNCYNTIYDGNAWWNQNASGCSAQFPNNRRISSVWVAN